MKGIFPSYDINTSYMLTKWPKFKDVPFVVLYHEENGKRIDDIAIFLNYRIVFGQECSLEIYKQFNPKFLGMFNEIMKLCSELRWIRSNSFDAFSDAAIVIESMLKDICSKEIYPDSIKAPIMYDRPEPTTTHRFREWHFTKMPNSDPQNTFVEICHYIYDNLITDFVLGPGGEIYFYQKQLKYSYTTRSIREAGDYILPYLLDASEMNKHLNSIDRDKDPDTYEQIFNLLMEYSTETVTGYHYAEDLK